MIKFNKIFAFVVMFVVLCACERGNGGITPDDDNSVDVEMPKHGYIFFNMENLSTRAELFNGGVLKQDFSVLGYRYAKSTSWETQRAVASLGKTIFYENNEGQVVESGEKMGVFGESEPTVQLIEWNGNEDGSGVHSYSPLQEWQAALRYAFFAWYPDTLTANDGRNTSSTATNGYYVGRPFITYSIPKGTTRAVRQSMVDVMTACRIDYTKAIDGAYVGLKMKHRLAVLDIKAMSIVDAKSLKKYLTDNGQEANFADDATVMVNIKNIRLKLSEIKKGAKFPLNTEKDSDGNVEPLEYSKTNDIIDTYKNIEYTGFDGATGDNAIPYFQKESDIKELVGANEKLILIPQPETITATLSFDYEILCNGTKIDYVSGSYSGETDIEGLAEGVYHYLLITVAKSGVAVKAVVVQDSWDGKDKTIDHEFN